MRLCYGFLIVLCLQELQLGEGRQVISRQEERWRLLPVILLITSIQIAFERLLPRPPLFVELTIPPQIGLLPIRENALLQDLFYVIWIRTICVTPNFLLILYKVANFLIKRGF